jgi:hypothetical protein
MGNARQWLSGSQLPSNAPSNTLTAVGICLAVAAFVIAASPFSLGDEGPSITANTVRNVRAS